MSEVKGIRVEMTVDDGAAHFYDRIRDTTTPADIVWWECHDNEVGLEVTAFSRDRRGCETWYGDDLEQLPGWIPEAPVWFITAIGEIL